MNPLPFQSAVAAWFHRTFDRPTPAQPQAWKAIRERQNVLIAAPTGSGKTLAAFLAVIDELIREGIAKPLPDETRIVYVSPLKALSNDISRNLEAPLAGIRQSLREQGCPDVEIRTLLRTGDTPPSERERMRRCPPHIVVTTPESLYVLLGSDSGREMLATTRTVIVDEIHAVAPNKRGSHLALSLERLTALCGGRLLRVGLSATQKPIEAVAQFLIGAGSAIANCRIVDVGHHRHWDLALELPGSPLEAVMSGEVWQQVYDRLAELITTHRTSLIFVNTRRLAERVSGELSKRLGEANVAAHHGSLAKEQRLRAERRLKQGMLKVLVATASLELGIDIGEIDLVCQLGSPHSIASFLQRVGRAGHSLERRPKGRLFPLSRDELIECTALLDCIPRGEMDCLTIPEQPLDVLAQQIIAEVACREWNEDELYRLLCRAWPYRGLARADYLDVLAMLAEGFSTRRGRRGALIHRDAVNGVLRTRRGSRLTALTSGGTIPDTGDYQVLLEPEHQIIGSVNEDFAVESLAGDVFQLGNRAYRILRTERGIVRVEDARGMPPTIPFWLGEAPGRTDELSGAVSRLRRTVANELCLDPSGDSATRSLLQIGLGESAAKQIVEYLSSAHAVFGCLPSQDTIVFERFFDEVGGMQLVIHSPYGSRINRAWGLALRKRFCRKFNFELQAAATEDSIVLSLTTAHSFELAEVARYLSASGARSLLVQALLDAPMFMTRWRWVAAVALALPRFRRGKRLVPQLARMEAEDLIVAVFPDQLACAENLAGEREIPDHPLVRQTISDCLTEAMDIAGLERLLRGIESGAVRVVARDLTAPSPLAAEVLTARPYAYLDNAPLEERRTQAVMSRRWLTPQAASDLGRLDADAIARVREEAWPNPTNADELHDALVWLGFLTQAEANQQPSWSDWLAHLAREKRVTQFSTENAQLLVAAERLPQFQAVWPTASYDPKITAPAAYLAQNWSKQAALIEIVRGRLEGQGPVAADELAAGLGVSSADLSASLAALEAQGFALRGRFTPLASSDQWCERRLLARIHSYTIKRLRSEIEPVAARDFLSFLLTWQRVSADGRMLGDDALAAVIDQLEGFEAPAAAWETEILPARIADYQPTWLDEQCQIGRLCWARLRARHARQNSADGRSGPIRSTPITLLARRHAGLWCSLCPTTDSGAPSYRAQLVIDWIRDHGASFSDELLEGTRLLRPQLEEALAELVALGLVTSDSFGGLRALIVPSHRRKPIASGRRRGRTVPFGIEDGGRWSLVRRPSGSPRDGTEAVEHVARALLRRYGVVLWRLLEREAPWLPSWRELLAVYRRLESRGEIRGGRFVAGFSGEQYALPEAIGMLRKMRRHPATGTLISVSAADPLNLVGILTPGPRLPALTGNRLLYRDGLPIAMFSGGEVQFLQTLESSSEWIAHNALLRGAVPESLTVLA